MNDLWQRLDRDFAEQIAGTTIPAKPEPMPAREATPVPVWAPKNGGHEL